MGNSATDAARGRAARTRLLLASAALAALVCACLPKKLTGPLILHPVPPVDQSYALAQGALVFTGPEFTVAARPWDYRLVAEEFRRSGMPNPFGDDDESVGRYLFLRVRLDNRSTRNLVFNPMRCWLIGDGQAPLVALENSDLVLFADERLAEAEARARAFRAVSFDIAVTVRPGQSIERYLVFTSPKEAPKRLMLSIEDLWHGATSHDLRFDFEPFPGK